MIELILGIFATAVVAWFGGSVYLLNRSERQWRDASVGTRLICTSIWRATGK